MINENPKLKDVYYKPIINSTNQSYDCNPSSSPSVIVADAFIKYKQERDRIQQINCKDYDNYICKFIYLLYSQMFCMVFLGHWDFSGEFRSRCFSLLWNISF